MIKALYMVLMLGFSTTACATTKKQVNEKVIWPDDNVVFIGHFGCLSTETAEEEIYRNILGDCTKYGKVPFILEGADVTPCGPNMVDVYMAYRCVKEKKEK